MPDPSQERSKDTLSAAKVQIIPHSAKFQRNKSLLPMQDEVTREGRHFATSTLQRAKSVIVKK